ncbi:hypothetical protein RJ641_035279 [Dillenia turbinata]|uniref:Uncharacterized protein n=1 Tax=Dillenia turbinata TaxID=194707 RepID=A0AAN8VK21_9MAGN
MYGSPTICRYSAVFSFQNIASLSSWSSKSKRVSRNGGSNEPILSCSILYKIHETAFGNCCGELGQA